MNKMVFNFKLKIQNLILAILYNNGVYFHITVDI